MINWRKDGESYWAWFAGDGPVVPYQGRSLSMAIGDLILMNGDRFGIQVAQEITEPTVTLEDIAPVVDIMAALKASLEALKKRS